MFFFSVLVITAGCVTIYFLVKYLGEYLRCVEMMRKLPGPKTVPILGNTLDFVCDEVTIFLKIRNWCRTYGPVFRLNMSSFYPSVNIAGAEQFEVIASSMKNIRKPMVYSFLNRWLGEGLLTSTGSKWHTRRRILTPAFHFSILQQFVGIFNSETERLVQILKKETEHSSTNVMPLISQFTLYTMAETSMGTKLNLRAEEDKKYVDSINKIGNMFVQRMRKPWFYFDWLYYNLSEFGAVELGLIDVLHRFTNNIIWKKAENFEKFEVDEHEERNYCYSKTKKLALLDLLLNAKANSGDIDNDGIRDEVNTFMFEGFDTTSVSICYTLLLLANHKDWQELAYQEILQVMGDSTKPPTIRDLREMKILERIIKESLRLYPSAPFIAKLLEEETTVDGFLLPKGIQVNIHIYDIHRNPKYWTDPEKFDPDRFSPDNCANRHPFAFVPFSAGPRNCIGEVPKGQKFVMLEFKAVFCGILRNFVLDPIDTPDSLKMVADMVLRPKNSSLRVKFSLRIEYTEMFIVNFSVVVAGCVILFFLVRGFIEHLRTLKILKGLPGPEPIPVLKNVLEFLGDDITLFRKVRYWARTYGPIYRIDMTSLYPGVNITGAEEFEAIAGPMKHIQKAPIYFFLNRWLGEGLLTSTGSKWQTRRKILTPAFHFSILQQFVGVFNNETKKLVEVLRNETEKTSTNVFPLISEFTLNTIAESSMGTKLNQKTKKDKEYITSINKIGHIFFQRLKKPWLYISCIYYNFSGFGRQEMKLVNNLHSFTNDIISKRAKNFEIFEVDENDESNYCYAKQKKLALLDLLLNAKMNSGDIDDEGIRDEVNTFMFEGFDTTSTSICFTLMVLANYKNWQELAYQEIIQVLGDSKKEPSIHDLNEMKILERIIKESLRLYPSVPFIARILEEDTMVCSRVIPKGVPINIHIYDIHRDPKHWPDPEKFDPDRFLTDNCVNRHPFAFVPFSAGPRNCIGQKFAMLELKTVYCGILRNFILEPVDTPNTLRLIPDLILRTENVSLEVKFRLRHPQ
ncbi:uncharacterized protein [Leptinotarsa decemlineata]|uniref:uncharacterized protein n=1 Tax=Leptinotarsa decemlineata TaxID=7539 RepID=UPI003D30410A